MLHVPLIKFASIWSSWKYLTKNKIWSSSLYSFLRHPVASCLFSGTILFSTIFFLQNKGYSVHITKLSYFCHVLAAGVSTSSPTDGFRYDKRSSHPPKTLNFQHYVAAPSSRHISVWWSKHELRRSCSKCVITLPGSFLSNKAKVSVHRAGNIFTNRSNAN